MRHLITARDIQRHIGTYMSQIIHTAVASLMRMVPVTEPRNERLLLEGALFDLCAKGRTSQCYSDPSGTVASFFERVGALLQGQVVIHVTQKDQTIFVDFLMPDESPDNNVLIVISNYNVYIEALDGHRCETVASDALSHQQDPARSITEALDELLAAAE